MTWHAVHQVVGHQPIESSDTTQRHPLNTMIIGSDPDRGGGEFVYLQAAEAIDQYEWCTYNVDDGSADLLAANAIGPVGIALSDIAQDSYGWFQVGGEAVGLVSTATAGVHLHISATDGTVDDAVVAGDRIKACVAVTAHGTPASGQVLVHLQRPYVDNGLGA